jgi:hypothetical protein
MRVKFDLFKVVYVLLCAAMLLLLIQYAVQVNKGGHPWKTGDWLINYSGGLVRRGFIGEVARAIAEVAKISYKWTTFFVQAFIFGSFLYLLLSKFYEYKNIKNSWLVLLSPAFIFMFWINANETIFRKEMLMYLSLIFTLKAFSNQHPSYFWYVLGLILYLVSGLSHEMALFIFPFFAFIVWDWRKSASIENLSALKYLVPIILSSALILFFALANPGTEKQMLAICDDLSGKNFSANICNGAISWIGRDAAYGFQLVQNYGIVFWINYLSLAILVFLPLFSLSLDRGIVFLIFASFLFMAPLFIIAVDYGRFISILFTSVVLVLIWRRPNILANTCRWNAALGFLYCFSWYLPNCCASKPGSGVLMKLFG